ncbi:helix-turn-helix domain-containing protein [Gordonia alkanivorans]|uniref:Putative DNA binding protein n=2 Tax=root TaxID=1 RepID=A0A162E148_9CAUD|nr:helix-turn-helix transcriptional regulator [Gordonia alkanivorans]YP_009324433.1 helix-turn-helix transcriptional regulator [Gordonia phage GAL1]AKJ72056.1 putative DNA binding protein [Gordonia phage GAL1]GAA13882.1 putative Xre family DNA-binding protein [Gordonia alkanivorans NBRC 16433]
MKYSRQEVARRIREARIARRMSQKALGDLVDMNSTAICRTETGQRTVTLEQAAAIAEVLGIDFGQLLGHSTDEILTPAGELRIMADRLLVIADVLDAATRTDTEESQP